MIVLPPMIVSWLWSGQWVRWMPDNKKAVLQSYTTIIKILLIMIVEWPMSKVSACVTPTMLHHTRQSSPQSSQLCMYQRRQSSPQPSQLCRYQKREWSQLHYSQTQSYKSISAAVDKNLYFPDCLRTIYALWQSKNVYYSNKNQVFLQSIYSL